MTAKNSQGYAAPIGIAADPVIFTIDQGELSLLLVRREEDPEKGKWSLPGGFVGEPESPEETVNRKLKEKTGMDPIHVEQLRTYATPTRDSRGWLPSVAYLALIPASSLPKQEREGIGWYKMNNLPPLAFDHLTIIKDGLERLRGKLWYSNIARGLLPLSFSLSEARNVYEAIGGHKYDPGNFGRDLKKLGLIKPTDKRRTEGRGRPAELYRFSARGARWSPQYGKKTAAERKK